MRPQLSIDNFNYDLPESRIAKYPLENRSDSKLVIFDSKRNILKSSFKNISHYIPEGSLILFNNTKVIRARLSFKKRTGAQIEIFCLEPTNNTDVQIAFAQRDESNWNCIVGNLKKWKEGALETKVEYKNREILISAHRLASFGDSHHVKFTWDDKRLSFGEIIELLGRIPIPPYLNRETEAIDTDRYQTVYSEHKGSVAAPTAGLHFTPEILETLKVNNISTDFVTLHVGAGTFKPVKSDTIDQHEMHVEHFKISKPTLEKLINNKGSLIAVGTTTTRTLESLYWLGVKINNGHNDLIVNQWDAYDIESNLSYKESLEVLLTYMTTNNHTELPASTGIMIAPGYQFKAIDGLITNFHQPKSTLLLLLGALIGDEWKRLYNFALENDFRFLSYGDSSLILR